MCVGRVAVLVVLAGFVGAGLALMCPRLKPTARPAAYGLPQAYSRDVVLRDRAGRPLCSLRTSGRFEFDAPPEIVARDLIHRSIARDREVQGMREDLRRIRARLAAWEARPWWRRVLGVGP